MSPNEQGNEIDMWGRCLKHSMALRIRYFDNVKSSTYCSKCEEELNKKMTEGIPEWRPNNVRTH